jgi:HPt (histidine-containing phosphotransfer) domain-containing protein
MSEPEDLEGPLDEELLALLVDLRDASGARILPAMVEDFAGEARVSLARMRELASRNDRALLAREAHRLRGSGGSLGAREFAQDCLEIERRARDAAGARLEDSVERAHGRLEVTMAALRGLLARVAALHKSIPAGVLRAVGIEKR